MLRVGRKLFYFFMISEPPRDEVPDKLLELSEEQNKLLKRKIELKEEMVVIQRQSLAVQEKQAAAMEKAVVSIVDTVKM